LGAKTSHSTPHPKRLRKGGTSSARATGGISCIPNFGNYRNMATESGIAFTRRVRIGESGSRKIESGKASPPPWGAQNKQQILPLCKPIWPPSLSPQSSLTPQINNPNNPKLICPSLNCPVVCGTRIETYGFSITKSGP
jgi:hypothetical protein